MRPDHAGKAACADRLELVDAAFDKPGGRAAKQLAEHYCSGCEIREPCLAEAMEHGEHGPWGGTSRTARTRNGGLRSHTANLRNIEGHTRGLPRDESPR